MIYRRKANSISSDPPKKHKSPPEFDLFATVHAPEYQTLINTPRPSHLEPAHKLTFELDEDSFTLEKYTLDEKYQRIIHHESKKEVDEKQFTRFLCSSPFKQKTYTDERTGETRKTGSFHELYRIDGKLVAFAVLDFLPNTISSVYFVYDPDTLSKFGMGKVSALREIAKCIEGGYKYYGLGNFPLYLPFF
jgi:arginyl-tRNA---protein transferase